MPSAAKSRRLLEPFTFFVDRSLGARLVVGALRSGCEAGEAVHAHDDHFAQDTTDTEWLGEVGRRGWVVLTKDARIRTNSVERDALLAARVACFALSRGEVTAATMGAVFCDALSPIRTVLRRYRPPIIATVSLGGEVRVCYGDGQELRPTKSYRPRKPR